MFTNDDAPKTDSPAAPKPTPKLAKKKAAKKKAAKKAASKRAPYPSVSKKCPYREGTMKAKAYALFVKGGERSVMITAIVKLGATENTASSWIQFFRRYVKTGKK